MNYSRLSTSEESHGFLDSAGDIEMSADYNVVTKLTTFSEHERIQSPEACFSTNIFEISAHAKNVMGAH